MGGREKLSFIIHEKPPPDVKEGDVLQAAIVDLKYPVESVFKDDQGNPKQQIHFHLRLDDGYEPRAFMSFYERPRERSALGQLCNTLIGITKENYKTVNDALQGLKAYGRVYVKVSGFRERDDGKLYPKWQVVLTKLPPKQTDLPTEESPTKISMAEALERVKGLPKEIADATIRHMKDIGVLAEGPQ